MHRRWEVQDYQAYVPVRILMIQRYCLENYLLNGMKYINLKGRFLTLNMSHLIVIFVSVPRLKKKTLCEVNFERLFVVSFRCLDLIFCLVYYLLFL